MNFSSNKNGSASSLDADLNFSSNKNESTSSLDVDLNFSSNKKGFASSLSKTNLYFNPKKKKSFVSSLNTDLFIFFYFFIFNIAAF